MCDAKTHLFYGLPVRTWSLVPAADAWPKLVKTLPFFDLLNLRIRSGTLQASKQDGTGSSAIERVPVEVWNVVKHKLVDLELQDANDQLMRNIDVNMWSCWGAGVRKPGKSNADSALPPFWTDICREADPYPDHSCPHWIDMWLTHMWSAEDFKVHGLRNFSLWARTHRLAWPSCRNSKICSRCSSSVLLLNDL